MKTIEQFEAEIAQKLSLIDGQMQVFQSNLGRIGQVIGKDATEVYDKLVYHQRAVVDDMATTTRRNTDIMESWVTTLDGILNVLAEVMHAIEAMEAPAESVDMLDVRNEVDQALNRASEAAETMVVEATGVQVGPDVFRYAITGLGAWLVLKLVGVKGVAGIGGAVAAAWYLGKDA